MRTAVTEKLKSGCQCGRKIKYKLAGVKLSKVSQDRLIMFCNPECRVVIQLSRKMKNKEEYKCFRETQIRGSLKFIWIRIVIK